MIIILKKLLYVLDETYKKKLVGLLIMSMLVSLVEIVGIAAIMPFIKLASDFSQIFSNDNYKYIYNLLNFSNEINFVIAFGFLLILFYLIRGILNIGYTYYLAKFSKGNYHNISKRLLNNYLSRTYYDFTLLNSSLLMKSIVNEAQNMTSIISTLLMTVSEIIIVVLIYTLMIYVNWEIALLLTIFLLINGLIIIRLISPRIRYEGKEREVQQSNFYKILSTTFGNFKLIKLHSNSDKILDKFSIISKRFAQSNVRSETYGYIPRFYLEALSFITIILITLYLLYQNDASLHETIPTLVLFVLSLYRLLPSINRIINNYNSFLFHHKAFDIVYEDLNYTVEELGASNLSSFDKITLKNTSFFYKKEHKVLNNINLTINKKDRIAFIGESGSGKSTLVDLIMGFYEPKDGTIYVNGDKLTKENLLSWRKKFSYIPQQIYLFDGSLAENIAFGKEIDESKVEECLAKVRLLEHINKFHDGIETNVGENGVKLSGGQKQRVAIARALYSEPDILVLDEATSALDNNTESEIMKEIYDIVEDKTLIVIAHRLSTIKRCNKVYKLEDGNLKEVEKI